MAQATKRISAAKRSLINVRISVEDRNVIDQAARRAGKTRTEFMIDAARRAAHDALLDTNLVLVDGHTFALFKRLFDAPPRSNERLRELMRLEAPWER